MKNNNMYKQGVFAKCQVCKKDVILDETKHGECTHCGWFNNGFAAEIPQTLVFPGVVSLNKAIALHEAGLPVVPSFDDFVVMLKHYSEVEFMYKGIWYSAGFCHGLTGGKATGIEFGASEIPESMQEFDTIEEFAANVKLDGYLLKDIWHNVENAKYM